MATEITTDEIIQDFGAYYIDEGQNKKRLVAAIRKGGETLEKFATPIITNDTKFKLANPVFQSLMRPFKKAFEPSGGITFHPNEIDLRQCKADVEIYPNDFQASWLGFLTGDDSRTMENWPIVRYIAEEYVAKQIEEDREMEVVYKGVYNANGNQPIDSFDGLHVQLKRGAVSQYPIHIVNGVGLLDNSVSGNVFAQIEKFDKTIPAQLKNKKLLIFVAQDFERQFMEDKRSEGFFFISSADQINTNIDFTKHIVVGVPSMNGTGHMFATLQENLLWCQKGSKGSTKIDIQKHDRCLHLLTDWWEGIGFACNQLVWATAETVAVEETSPSTSGSGSGSTPETSPSTSGAGGGSNP